MLSEVILLSILWTVSIPIKSLSQCKKALKLVTVPCKKPKPNQNGESVITSGNG